MMSKPDRPIVALSVVAAIAAATVAVAASGCGAAGTTASPHASQPSIQGVRFQARAGTDRTRILSLGGLTLLGTCRRHPPNPTPFLSVAAKTSVDNAVISSHFGQQRRGSPNYTFVLDDFDRSYGQWDVLGTNPDKTAGTLNYSRPDGGQVSATFVADEGTSQGACVFAGTAVYAP